MVEQFLNPGASVMGFVGFGYEHERRSSNPRDESDEEDEDDILNADEVDGTESELS